MLCVPSVLRESATIDREQQSDGPVAVTQPRRKLWQASQSVFDHLHREVRLTERDEDLAVCYRERQRRSPVELTSERLDGAAIEGANGNLARAVNRVPSQSIEPLPRVSVCVDDGSASRLAASMQSVGIWEADLDPRRDLTGEVSDEKSRLVAGRHPFGELDALLELEAVGQHPDHHVLSRLGGVPRHAEIERLEDASIHVCKVDGELINRRREGHGLIVPGPHTPLVRVGDQRG